jgi:hypothetical protein
MVNGNLKPTIEEEMKIKGHGTISIGLFLMKGTTHDGEEVKIFYNPTCIFVTYKDREVTFDLANMASEAVQLVEDDIKKRKEKCISQS